MESSNLMLYTSEDLKSLTNNFDHTNSIGVTQFGKLYRGFIKPDLIWSQGRYVTVKIWDQKTNCLDDDDHYLMVKEEVEFLSCPKIKDNPYLVKLIGFCCEREVRGVVYDLNSRDTLHNLIRKDDVTWIQRVNIALQLAHIIEFLHGQNSPYMILNICDSHIILDWDCTPKLCDFGLLSGELNEAFKTLKKKIPMPIGFADPYFATRDEYRQSCSDIFSFGVVLLGLISKRVFDPYNADNKPRLIMDNLVHCWAKKEFRPNCSLAHKSLLEDWGYNPQDGTTVTEIGMRCIEFFPTNRPSVKTVVEGLESLIVLQRIGDNRPNKRDKKFHASE